MSQTIDRRRSVTMDPRRHQRGDDGSRHPDGVLGVLGSLALDYVARMKVYVNVNWFHAETFPIPWWDEAPYGERGATLVRRLNMIGADFGEAG